MDYRVDITYKPLYELMTSLHTYICRKSHKKIDLEPAWVKETTHRLTPEFVSMLSGMEIDADWKLTYLLVHLCEEGHAAEDFLAWLDGKTAGDLFERIAEYSHQFPVNMGEFRSRTLKVISEWNDQYFRHIDPEILKALSSEERIRKSVMASSSPQDFIDRTTNGQAFFPKDGLEQLVLVPQYHFQPMNVIYHFGKLTVCHYSSRIDLGEGDSFPAQEYRMVRALGERSRLKILRYLNQGPRSFTEIVRYLKLSKGITHDHVSKLRSGGFIRAHFEGENIVEYSLRLDTLGYLHDKLMDYITQDQGD